MKLAYLVVLPLLLSAGCAPAFLGGPGSEPSETSPRIVDAGDDKMWNYPRLFGPVPPSLQQAGDDYCRDAGFGRADGYHPRALDKDGNPYPKGGFYCVDRVDSSI
jgi:hypothetical protein